MFRVEMLPARQGDCVWIEYGSGRKRSRVLVDGGPPPTWEVLKGRVARRTSFDLIVATHVDIDHVYGMLRMLTYMSDDVHTDDVWFNGWKHLPRQPRDIMGAIDGEMLSAVIERRGLPWNTAFGQGAVQVTDAGDLKTVALDGGMQLTVLLPTDANLEKLRPEWADTVREHDLDPGDLEAALERWRQKEKLPADVLGDERPDPDVLARRAMKKDPSKPNASSVAFLAEYEGKSCLFTGDAHPGDLENAVQRLAQARGGGRLTVDATKLSHHGSAVSTSDELLELLDCPRYLVSTNGASYGHPKPEAISRVVVHSGGDVELYFNYRTKFNKIWDDRRLKAQFRYATVFPADGEQGLAVDI